MLVDLAGSERAADSREHSAERIAETKGSFFSVLKSSPFSNIN
jgi:hypothetical protein